MYTFHKTHNWLSASVSGSEEELTGDGPVYEYVLQEPVSVEERGVLGIGLPVVNLNKYVCSVVASNSNLDD